jgi:hypothetical protein
MHVANDIYWFLPQTAKLERTPSNTTISTNNGDKNMAIYENSQLFSTTQYEMKHTVVDGGEGELGGN